MVLLAEHLQVAFAVVVTALDVVALVGLAKALA